MTFRRLALTLLIPLGGCGFIEGIKGPEGDSVVYVGTLRDVQHISGDRRHANSCMDLTSLFVPFYVIDLPLSFALDTGVLPFTLVYELLCRPTPLPPSDVPVEKLPAEKK
jgi:uncharacterized protein YceK